MAALMTDKSLLARLIGHDSTSAKSNRPIAEFVADYVDAPGTVIELDEAAGGAKVNVIARRGPTPGAEREGLVLCGHLDVVPAAEPDWSGDPFTLRETDGRWLGRGACDMKGFIALAMNVLAAASPTALRHPLALVLTCDEELGSLGAQRLAAADGGRAGALPRAVIVGEPTSLRVVRMHKGHLKLRVTLSGRAAHSGSPHLGRSAIEPAGAVVTALAGLARTMREERAPSSKWFREVPFPVLNVGTIRGGEAVNVVPDRCVIELGVRVLPGEDAAPFVARVRRAVEEAASGSGADHAVEIVNENPPMLLDAAAPIHERLCVLVGQGETYGVSFCSDAGVLQRDLGMECVLYGPGSIEAAHRADEFVPVEEMRRARETLERAVHGWCLS